MVDNLQSSIQNRDAQLNIQKLELEQSFQAEKISLTDKLAKSKAARIEAEGQVAELAERYSEQEAERIAAEKAAEAARIAAEEEAARIEAERIAAEEEAARLEAERLERIRQE